LAPLTLSKGIRVGDYEVQALLVSSGMREVYRARDLRLGQDVDIQVLPSLAFRGFRSSARFVHEARAAAAFKLQNKPAPKKPDAAWFGEMILSRTKDPANRRDLVREAGFRAPSGHPDRCLVGISLILLRRAWSKLDVQVVVGNCVGDPFKAWVAGSSPAALTKISMP